MKIIIPTILIALTCCNQQNKQVHTETTVTRSVDYQAEITQLLEQDREYKLLEEEYLREIAIAQDNDDQDAYKFYFNEYIQVPRIPLEEWMENEPEYYKRKSAKQVVSEYRNK